MTIRSFFSRINLAFISLSLLPLKAFAQLGSSSLPWEGPIDRIVDSLTGPVARGAAVISIVVTGLTLAFGEGGGFFRRAVTVVFGLSIALTAASFGVSFFR